MIMQFDKYIFPYNPRKIEISNKKTARVFSTLDNNLAVQTIGVSPIVVNCEGEFLGESASDNIRNLRELADNNVIGVLVVPNIKPIYAQCVNLDFIGEGMGHTVTYKAQFVQAKV